MSLYQVLSPLVKLAEKTYDIYIPLNPNTKQEIRHRIRVSAGWQLQVHPLYSESKRMLSTYCEVFYHVIGTANLSLTTRATVSPSTGIFLP